ncbi:FtsQ-type POTRA domain-containing protein [Staphylococcus chromogenes]|nr:FtsQ-type POTRA domain-containing protein [Staphylococcus chromogenes]
MLARNRWKILALTIALLLVISGIVAYFVPVLKVRDIAVTGNVQVSAEEIQAASGIIPGDNVVRVRENEVASRVATIPWVAKVSVQRTFPTSVEINVVERQAILFTKRSDGEHLIDESAIPFVIDSPPPGVVELSGQQEDKREVLLPAVGIVKALDPQNRADLERIDARSAYEFTLYFKGGKEVYWGSADQSHDKALATKTVLQRDGRKWNVSAPGLVTLQP